MSFSASEHQAQAAVASHRHGALLGGGTDGNEQLTARTGVLLLLLLAALGVTILRIGQLIWVHLFLGLLLLGPVALKLSSTGYRFVRYYAHQPDYRLKGPPKLIMRLIAPGVVVTTVVVFLSGLVLLFDGPRARGTWLLVHKASFFVWLAFTGVHVLGHLADLPGLLGSSRGSASVAQRPATAAERSRGEAGRWLALTGAVVAGLVLAVVLIPDFAAWTHGALAHHHHHHAD